MTVKFQLSDPGPIELTTFPSYKHSGSLNKSYFKHSAAMVVIIFHKSYIVPVKYEKIYSERRDHEAMVTDEKKIILITMTFHLPFQKVMKSNLSYFIKNHTFWYKEWEISSEHSENTLLASHFEKFHIFQNSSYRITLTPNMVLPLFATRFAAYPGGILVSFIQPHLF